MSTDPLSEIIPKVKPAISAAGETVAAAARRSAELARQAAPTAKMIWEEAKARLMTILLVLVSLIEWPFRQWPRAILNVIALPLGASVYVSVGAMGTRLSHPFFGTKLYKAIPLLAKYRFAHEYDLAVIAALILGGACAVMVARMWRVYLRGSLGLPERFHSARAAKSASCLACILLLVDFYIFMQGSSESSLWEDGVTTGGVILAIGWTTLLIVYGWLDTVLER